MANFTPLRVSSAQHPFTDFDKIHRDARSIVLDLPPSIFVPNATSWTQIVRTGPNSGIALAFETLLHFMLKFAEFVGDAQCGSNQRYPKIMTVIEDIGSDKVRHWRLIQFINDLDCSPGKFLDILIASNLEKSRKSEEDRLRDLIATSGGSRVTSGNTEFKVRTQCITSRGDW